MATAAKKVDYEGLRQDPRVRSFLDILSRGEGTYGRGDNGYNIAFGGAPTVGYDKHPKKLYDFTQTDGVKNQTSAAGRYQIIAKTAQGLEKQLGTTDFSPATQDKMAIELIRQNGALDNILTGDYEGAINKLGGVWASLPSSPYAQPRRSMEELLGTGAVQLVNQGGQQQVAIPENDFEQQYMQQFASAGHPQNVQSQLTSALAQISTARDSLLKNDPLFDMHPVDLDGELLDLIDKA
jgi:muramidase (phage lysozyme)